MPWELITVCHSAFCVCGVSLSRSLSRPGRMGCPHPGADGLLMLNGNYISQAHLSVLLPSDPIICNPITLHFTQYLFPFQC